MYLESYTLEFQLFWHDLDTSSVFYWNTRCGSRVAILLISAGRYSLSLIMIKVYLNDHVYGSFTT